MSTENIRKFFNKDKQFVLGLGKLVIKRYFDNNRKHLTYGRFLHTKNCVNDIIQSNRTYLARVKDVNSDEVSHPIADFIQIPILNEQDINPIQTVCDCTTYKMAYQSQSSLLIKEIMCPCIAALLWSLRDGGSSTSKFDCDAWHINFNHHTIVINDTTYQINKLHVLCRNPSDFWKDLGAASEALKDKYTCLFITSYSTTTRVDKIQCVKCEAVVSPDVLEGGYLHKCTAFPSTNVNKYSNKKISMLQFSILFANIDIVKFFRSLVKIFGNKYMTFQEIADRLKYSRSLVSDTYYRIASVCSVIMDNTTALGSESHPDLELDATRGGTKYYGNPQNPTSREQAWVETIIGRDVNAKGRKPVVSKAGGAESLTNYVPFIKKYAQKGANMNSDEHLLYASNFINNNWQSSRTKHKHKEWVNPNTTWYPSRLKVHGNNSEEYNDTLKTQRRIHRGLGSINNGNKSRQKVLDLENWKQSYTNGKADDCIIVFLKHCSVLLKSRMPELLNAYGYKECEQ